jgi:predicted kinase
MDLEDRGRPDLARRFLVVEALGAIRLRSDVERKRLFGFAPLERSTSRGALDLYTPDVTQHTYAQLAQHATRVVQADTLTIDTDAPQALEHLRETVRAMGEEP